MVLQEIGCKVWTGFNWRRVASSGRLLWRW